MNLNSSIVLKSFETTIVYDFQTKNVSNIHQVKYLTIFFDVKCDI